MSKPIATKKENVNTTIYLREHPKDDWEKVFLGNGDVFCVDKKPEVFLTNKQTTYLLWEIGNDKHRKKNLASIGVNVNDYKYGYYLFDDEDETFIIEELED